MSFAVVSSRSLNCFAVVFSRSLMSFAVVSSRSLNCFAVAFN